MAVKHLSYRDLSPEQRKKGAADARQRVVAMMSTPFLPAEQRAYFEKNLEQINQWERGALSELPAVAPQNHTVQLTETVPVKGTV